MRRDRDGSELEDLDEQPHACDDGWAGYDADGRTFPYLACRPHLRRTDSGGRWTVRRSA